MADERQDLFSDMQSQAKSFYDRLPATRRWLLFGIIGSVIIGLLLAAYFAQQTTYSSLVSGITPGESAKIAQKLTESQIPYIIAPGGGGILVPSELADQAKLDIANSDLLNGGIVGLEIFDQTNYTSTEFQQNIQLRRALEGELARLIMKINLIETAKVILAIPNRSIYLDQQDHPTAAVHLELKSSQPLGSDRVKTILNLVSSGVPGLQIENVKVSDQYGNLYTSDLQGGLQRGGDDQNLAFKHNIESYLEAKILDQLQKIAGREGVKVKVSAEVNTESAQIEEKLIDPDLQVVLSEQTQNEQSTGSRSIPVGVPGITSNSPEIASGTGEVANVAENNKSSRTVNYENSFRIIKRETFPGEIRRLTLSVLIDDKQTILPVDEEGNARIEKIKWETDELEQISLIAQNAVGFNSERGDQIEVRNISFNVPQVTTAVRSNFTNIALQETWLPIAKYVFFAVLVLLVLMYIVRPVMKKISEQAEDAELIIGLPKTLNNIENPTLATQDGAEIGPDEADSLQDDLTEGGFAPPISKPPRRNQIIEQAKQDIPGTANLIRSWLKEK